MIKLYEQFVESLNESVTEKDWIRMIDLFALGKDGESVANKIKDKTKAMNRFVAGLRITNSKLDYVQSIKKYYGAFNEFGNRALELGATVEEIELLYNETSVPSNITAKLDTYIKSNVNKGFLSSLIKTLIDEGFGVICTKGGNATTSAGKEVMRTNGRKWTIGYMLEITLKDENKINLGIDAITDEGGGSTSYIVDNRASDNIFRNLYGPTGVNKFNKSILDALNKIK